MVRFTLVDDDQEQLAAAAELIRDYGRTRLQEPMDVVCYNDPHALLETLAQQEPSDVYILDIVMPVVNGIDLGSHIRALYRDAVIILLTSSRDFGVESYSIQALDYMLKPCARESLFAALDRAMGVRRAEDGHFPLHVTDGFCAVPFREILWVEYYNHRLVFHMVNGELVESLSYREPFAELIRPLLDSGRFVRVSASFVLHMKYVKKLRSKEFHMQGGRIFPITRTYIDSRSIYMDYVLGKR